MGKLGFKHSKESIEKMKGLHSGKNNGMYGKTGELNPNYGKGLPGDKNGMFGKVPSAETRQKISKANKGKTHPQCSGVNNHFYNPTLTDEDRIDKRTYPEYKAWRSKVYQRDDYTCQKCSVRGGELQAHHIVGYRNNPDERVSLDNGITLCKRCHGDFHHQYGYNNTRIQLEEFLQWK